MNEEKKVPFKWEYGEEKGQIKILSHAKVRNGDLFYDHKEQIR